MEAQRDEWLDKSYKPAILNKFLKILKEITNKDL